MNPRPIGASALVYLLVAAGASSARAVTPRTNEDVTWKTD